MNSLDPAEESCRAMQILSGVRRQQYPYNAAVKLLHELSLGPRSRMHRYLEMLPEHVDMPWQWTLEELSELQNPTITAVVCFPEPSTWPSPASSFLNHNSQTHYEIWEYCSSTTKVQA